MMKTALVLCALLTAGPVSAMDRTPVVADIDAADADAEVLAYNRLVTDAEINEYFEFMIRPDAKALAEWHNLLPETRASRIAEYRSVHDQARTRIPVLRELSPKERSDLEAMAPFLAASAASADSARERLLAFSDDDYRIIVAAGIALIEARRKRGDTDRRTRGWTQLTQDFPQEIAFLRPELIRVMDNSCDIFLHKGIGRGIGYGVRQHEDGRASLSSFDDYESWQRTQIKLGEE
jgi:hypothetical protein